jgi:sugar transferase (PEP-CTERM/EpsH1 system associated)
MRILWIKTELLHPVDKGGRIRTYHMLRALARRHHVTYLTLDDGTAASDASERAKEYASKVVTVPFRPAAKFTARFFLDLARNLFSPLPYAIARYRSAEMQRQIEQLAAEADLIVCDFLAPSVNVPRVLQKPTVLFQHNVEAMIWERHAAVARNPVRRAYMREQCRRMHRFEAQQCDRFDHVVAVSEVDATEMRVRYRARPVSHIATGVDLDYFIPSATGWSSNNALVFVGSMDWMPNDDGILWFAADVFPHVRAMIPDATLNVVGRSPSAAMRQLASRVPGITVTGAVPDVRPHMIAAAVSIVPLRIGGGTRLKIYEAMAMGLPIVSTSIGAEGLPIAHGEHLLVADDARAQSAAVVQLLGDRTLARRLALNALSFVRENCSWDAVAEQFMSQCLSAGRSC